MKKQYVGIDLFKFFSAIMVMMIHCTSYNHTFIRTYIVDVLACTAVPFFFIVSGFFLSRKIRYGKKEAIIIYEKKLLKMYVFWTIVSLPIALINVKMSYPGEYLFWGLFILRSFFFTGSCGVYWYLLSMICATPIIYYFVNKRREKLLFALSVLLYAFGYLWECGGIFVELPGFKELFQISDFIFGSTRNFLMQGLLYMSIGYFISDRKYEWKWFKALVVLIICIVLKYYENQYVQTSGIVQIFEAIAMFQLARSLEMKWFSKQAEVVKEYSIVLYLVHFPFVLLIDPYLINSWYVNYPIVIALGIFVYIFIKKINNERLCQFFNLKYSE